MADETTRGAVTQTGDVRPAAGAMNSALGRTSTDLATDSPAGFGPDPIAGTDASDTFSDNDRDTEGRDRPIRDRDRKRNPDIPPDERLGLRPTVAGDAAPDLPAYPVSGAGTRMATGFVAGLAAGAAVVAVTYLLVLTGVLPNPGFFYTAQARFGDRGAMTHLVGSLGLIIEGGLLGMLFGLLVRKPTPAKGMIFGLLPALLAFLIAPMGSRPLIAALLLNVVVYGFLLGRLASWWLRTPSTTDVTPG